MNGRRAKQERRLLPPMKGRLEDQDWGRCSRCRQWKRGPWLHAYAGNDPTTLHRLPPLCMGCGEEVIQNRAKHRPQGYTAILDYQDEAHPEFHRLSDAQ